MGRFPSTQRSPTKSLPREVKPRQVKELLLARGDLVDHVGAGLC